MALAIATNNAAMRAAVAASSVNRDMETSMARLSSGKRINSASDDAAGVAISSRLTAEIRGTNQAVRFRSVCPHLKAEVSRSTEPTIAIAAQKAGASPSGCTRNAIYLCA